ncbi:hypothetical protein GCM10027448_15460 [Nocardioides dilutus]
MTPPRSSVGAPRAVAGPITGEGGAAGAFEVRATLVAPEPATTHAATRSATADFRITTDSNLSV